MKIKPKQIKSVWFISDGNPAPREGDALFLSYDDCKDEYDNIEADEQNERDEEGDEWGEYHSPANSPVFPPGALAGMKGRMWFDGQELRSSRGEFDETFDQAHLVEVEVVA
jgi:hypothetical protein